MGCIYSWGAGGVEGRCSCLVQGHLCVCVCACVCVRGQAHTSTCQPSLSCLGVSCTSLPMQPMAKPLLNHCQHSLIFFSTSSFHSITMTYLFICGGGEQWWVESAGGICLFFALFFFSSGRHLLTGLLKERARDLGGGRRVGPGPPLVANELHPSLCISRPAATIC